MVGTPSRNNWAGRVKEQVVLEDFVFVDNVNAENAESPEKNWIGNDGELSF